MVQDEGIFSGRLGEEAKKPHLLTGRLRSFHTRPQTRRAVFTGSVVSDDGTGTDSALNPGPLSKVQMSSGPAGAGGPAGCLRDPPQGKKE